MSQQGLQNLVVALFLVGLPVVMLLFIRYQLRQEKEAWLSLAAQHGWKVNGAHSPWWDRPREMSGLYRGRQFSLRSEPRGKGSKTHVYVLRLALGDALPRDLSLKAEGLGNKLLKLLGSRDEEVGDAELDAVLNLKHVLPQASAVLRTPLVRQRLLALHERFRSAFYAARFSIQGGLFEAEFPKGTLSTHKHLGEAVTLVLDLADALDDAARSAPGEGARAPTRGG